MVAVAAIMSCKLYVLPPLRGLKASAAVAGGLQRHQVFQFGSCLGKTAKAAKPPKSLNLNLLKAEAAKRR